MLTTIALWGKLRQYVMLKITFPCSGERTLALAFSSLAFRTPSSSVDIRDNSSWSREIYFQYTKHMEYNLGYSALPRYKHVNSSRVVQTLDLQVWDSPNLRF